MRLQHSTDLVDSHRILAESFIDRPQDFVGSRVESYCILCGILKILNHHSLFTESSWAEIVTGGNRNRNIISQYQMPDSGGGNNTYMIYGYMMEHHDNGHR